jgi:hypothetical protein
VLARLLTKQDILQLVSQDSTQELFRHTMVTYFGSSRIEFQLCCLWIRFVSQGVVCFHSVDFGGHALDNQYPPRFFVDNLRKDSQVLSSTSHQPLTLHRMNGPMSSSSLRNRRTIQLAGFFALLSPSLLHAYPCCCADVRTATWRRRDGREGKE